MTRKMNDRFPNYPDDADYTTNANSYYEELARKNKLMKILAERIYDYDLVIAEKMEEIEKVLAEVVDIIGEGFNEEIEILLIKWVEDGTLDHIINETLMNKKADKVELEELKKMLLAEMSDLSDSLTKEMETVKTQTDTKINEIQQETETALNQLDEDVKNRFIENDESTVYNNGITFSKHFDTDSQTAYYLTEIPYRDPETNERLVLKQHTDLNNPRIVEDFAKDLDSDFVINAGWGEGLLDYVWIEDGQVRNNRPTTAPSRYTLGIKEDGTLQAYHNTDANQLINEGVVHAHTAFTPVILNGRLNRPVFNASTGLGEKHPRQVIGQYADKSLIVLTTDGRNYEGQGMTSEQVANILLNKGVEFAYMTDGGGSTQTVVRHQMINNNTNNTWVVDDFRRGRGNYKRPRQSVLYIETPSKKIKDEATKQISKDLGNLRNKFNQFSQSTEVEWEPYLYRIGGTDDQMRYDTQFGMAVRIGTMVFAYYYLKGTRTGTEIGNLRMGRLPYYPKDYKQIAFVNQRFDGLSVEVEGVEKEFIDPTFNLVESNNGRQLYLESSGIHPETMKRQSLRIEHFDDFEVSGLIIYPVNSEHYLN